MGHRQQTLVLARGGILILVLWVTYLSLYPFSFAHPTEILRKLEEGLSAPDILNVGVHAPLFVLLGGLFAIGTATRANTFWTTPMARVLWIYCLVLEVAQVPIRYRHPRLGDLLFNLAWVTLECFSLFGQ